jgi:hypothetical protein
MEQYIYNPESEEIEGIKGGVLYDSYSLDDMSIEARQRLAELTSEDNGRDWMACWEILVTEGLYPGKVKGQ